MRVPKSCRAMNIFAEAKPNKKTTLNTNVYQCCFYLSPSFDWLPTNNCFKAFIGDECGMVFQGLFD